MKRIESDPSEEETLNPTPDGASAAALRPLAPRAAPDAPEGRRRAPSATTS